MFYERLMLIWKIWLNKIFKYKISTIIKFRKEKRNNLKLKNNYSSKNYFYSQLLQQSSDNANNFLFV